MYWFLAHINRKSIDPTQYPDRDFIYIDISKVEKETGIIDFSQAIKGKNAPLRARRIAPKGRVIISTVRPNLKGFAFAERDTTDLCSQRVSPCWKVKMRMFLAIKLCIMPLCFSMTLRSK